MQALDLLLNRASAGRLLAPAPTAEERELMFRAALRAPDHGQLRPWRFISIEAEARQALGELLAAAQAEDPAHTPLQLEKARAMPLRAPWLVAVVAHLSTQPKVPESEQLLSAGCAAHGLLLAAQALGYGAVWRSGPLSTHPRVLGGLGVAADERLIGFIYLGSLDGPRRVPAALAPTEFVSTWPAV